MLNNKMTILVTGGCGFIGSNLVDVLISQGNQVVVIDNMSSGLEENMNKSAVYLSHDIKDYISEKEKLIDILEEYNVEIIYHLAALSDVRLSINDPIECYIVNQLASVAILDIALEVGINKFIFSSTSAVYGAPTYQPVDEDHPIGPISPYGLSKLGFEQYAKYKSNKKTEIISFRLPNVYGPRQRSDLEGGVVAMFYDLMIRNKNVNFYGDGYQTRDWVHVQDIVKAFTLILEKTLSNYEVITLGSGEENTLWDLFNYLSTSTGYNKSPVILGERHGDIKYMCMSNKKLKKIFGWTPIISLDDGVNLLG